MARTDRLMRLIDLMRRLPAPVTAARLAEETDVSLRQLYRDITTLRAGGALIDGAAGVGYTLTEDPALPPQSFSRMEIEALTLAVSSLERIGDAALTRAGKDALARIIATLPDRQSRQALHSAVRAWFPPDDRPAVTIDLDPLRRALWEETSVVMHYRDMKDARTEREIWPLGLSYGEGTLMLLAHCRLRMDFRVFHVARIETLAAGGESFRPRRVGLLREYAAMRRQAVSTG